MKTYRKNSKVFQAAQEFISLRDRHIHPDGEFDKAGRWYPTTYYPCCETIRSPSRSYPYSHMVHCRTAAHVAHKYGVIVKDVRACVRQIEPPSQNRANGTMYKTVAVTEDGRYVSIFDGETEYRIGIQMEQRARQNHGGGYYVYSTMDEAENVEYPNDSKAKDFTHRAVLEIDCAGLYCRYGSKYSFSKIIPVRVVKDIKRYCGNVEYDSHYSERKFVWAENGGEARLKLENSFYPYEVNNISQN